MDTKSYFSTHQERILSDWYTFLSFKSVSTDPVFNAECEQCAAWVETQLRSMGARTEFLRGNGKPVVFGELPGDPSKPTVLFYGHYDVQPVDPIELWKSNAFEPTLREGRVYARGAQDNKGQVTYVLKAIEALRSEAVSSGNAQLLPTIKFVIEGEEECGSDVLTNGLSQWKEKFKADILLVCDTGMLSRGLPTITMGLRGIVGCEVRVKGAHVDLHSGVYGGIVKNPGQVICELVSKAYNPDGSIAIPGFYDGVALPAQEDRDLAAQAPLSVTTMEAALGTKLVGGEVALPVLERRGFRPTLEVNGLGAGYQGEGGKTVIPSVAFAKITSRIVVGQDPVALLQRIVSFFKDNAPEGVTVEVVNENATGGALQLSSNSPVIQKAADALRTQFQREPIYLWEGASIPLVGALRDASGGEAVLVGFGLEEDLIHAPNESFSLEQFEQGFHFVANFIASL